MTQLLCDRIREILNTRSEDFMYQVKRVHASRDEFWIVNIKTKQVHSVWECLVEANRVARDLNR